MLGQSTSWVEWVLRAGELKVGVPPCLLGTKESEENRSKTPGKLTLVKMDQKSVDQDEKSLDGNAPAAIQDGTSDSNESSGPTAVNPAPTLMSKLSEAPHVTTNGAQILLSKVFRCIDYITNRRLASTASYVA